MKVAALKLSNKRTGILGALQNNLAIQILMIVLYLCFILVCVWSKNLKI